MARLRTDDHGGHRQGVAQAILGGLAAEAVRRGANGMYLGVLADNDAAIALYEAAGFRTTHEYCYFTQASEESRG